jgi:hypothetical protein
MIISNLGFMRPVRLETTLKRSEPKKPLVTLRCLSQQSETCRNDISRVFADLQRMKLQSPYRLVSQGI